MPLGEITAIIGVADVGIRTSSAIGSLIQNWNNASTDLVVLLDSLDHITSSIEEAQRFSEIHSSKPRAASGSSGQLERLSISCGQAQSLLQAVKALVRPLRPPSDEGVPKRIKCQWMRKRSEIKHRHDHLAEVNKNVREIYDSLRTEIHEKVTTEYQEASTALILAVHAEQLRTNQMLENRIKSNKEQWDTVRMVVTRPKVGSVASQAPSPEDAVRAYPTFHSQLEKEVESGTSPSSSLVSLSTFKEEPSQLDIVSASSKRQAGTQQTCLDSTCDMACRCHCHKKGTRRTAATPLWVQWVVGRVVFSAYHVHDKCNQSSCRVSRFRVYEIRWTFPRLLGRRELDWIFSTVPGSPQFALLCRRRVNFSDDNNLMRLAWAGDADTTDLLIRRGHAVWHDMDADNGRTALEAAIDSRKIRVIQTLLRNGARFHVESDNYKSPGDYATELLITRNAPEELLQLLEVNIMQSDYVDDWSLSELHYNVLYTPEALRKELRKRPKLREMVNNVDHNGRTPLHWAALKGDFDAISVLLQLGADINAKDKDGSTPLHEVARSRSPKALETLMAARPDHHAINKLGQEVIHLVALHVYEQINEFLDPFAYKEYTFNEPSDTLKTAPIGYAAMANNVRMMEKLIQHGASMDAPDWEGDLPLFEAINFSSPDALKFLISDNHRHQAGYMKKNGNQQGLLHKAAKRANRKTLEILAAAKLDGLDPDAPDKDNMTPRQLLNQRARKGFLHDGVEDAFDKLIESVQKANRESPISLDKNHLDYGLCTVSVHVQEVSEKSEDQMPSGRWKFFSRWWP